MLYYSLHLPGISFFFPHPSLLKRTQFFRDTNYFRYTNTTGRSVTWWLRHYAITRQVAGSIPDGFIEIFQ